MDKEFQKDFDTLDNIFNKELSQYMSQISGATVGDKEVERLQRQVPNLDMSETQFETAMSIYEQGLKNANRYFLNQYGFSDMDKASQVLLGKKSVTTKPESAQIKGASGVYNITSIK